MQEIKKRRIVLASVLKPVRETRMFEKLGQSLAALYDVHIIGARGREENESLSSIRFHSLPPFERLSLSRMFAPFRIMKKILTLKPDTLIVCTHELLFIALIVKVILGCTIVYDVQENYSRNILFTNAFPRLIRPFLAFYVRAKEWFVSPLIDFYFLAEAGYEKEMAFLPKRKVVLENKLQRPAHLILPRKSQHDGKIHFLFSGTLAESTGVFVAIDLATHLYGVNPDVHLLIIGYCSARETRLRLERLATVLPFLELITGDVPIPHSQILSAIQRADVGIISYPPNPSTSSAIPTKLYEYLGYQLPILLIDHVPWLSICEPFDAAISFSPESPEPDAIMNTLMTQTFYSAIPNDVFWDSEAKKLLATVAGLLSKGNK